MPARADRAHADGGGGGRPPAPSPRPRAFTRGELRAFDGARPGRPVLIAYRGRVFDVTASFLWTGGRHFWIRAGRDLTGHMEEGPHDESVLDTVPCVGWLSD